MHPNDPHQSALTPRLLRLRGVFVTDYFAGISARRAHTIGNARPKELGIAQKRLVITRMQSGVEDGTHAQTVHGIRTWSGSRRSGLAINPRDRNAWRATRWHTIAPVSYTHLDVYKRQAPEVPVKSFSPGRNLANQRVTLHSSMHSHPEG